MSTSKVRTNRICHSLAYELVQVIPVGWFLDNLQIYELYDNMYRISGYLATKSRKRITGGLALLSFDQLLAYYALKHFIRKKLKSTERFHVYSKKRSNLPWFTIYTETCGNNTRCKIDITMHNLVCIYYTNYKIS